MKTIAISEATDAQLLQYAQILGADVNGHEPRGDLITHIQMIMPDTTDIRVNEDQPAPVGAAPTAPAEFGADPVNVVLDARLARDSKGDPRVTLRIPTQERDGATMTEDVNVGVNGVITQLKRGTDLIVPFRVYEALNNARLDVITHDDQGEVVVSEAQAYPFQVSVMPLPQEVAEWRARTQDVELA